MAFKDKLAVDARNVILNKDEFAETVIYTPKGGSPKSIEGIVSRSQADSNEQDQGRMLHRQCEIWIANDASEGVVSVDKGDDKVSLPPLLGQASVDWRVVDIF